MHVGDRLLTRGSRAFDAVSNKSLVYFARDALAVIGYSGVAYVEDTPTDEWIAQVLTGVVFPEKDDRRGAIRIGPRDQMLDIGQSAELLRNGCTAVARTLHLAQHYLAPQIVIAGWQAGQRALIAGQRARLWIWRPIIWTIEYSKREAAYIIDRTPRYGWWERAGLYLSVVPASSPLTNEEISALGERLTRANADDAEQQLVATIRGVAQREPTVGPHCMSVLLPPPTAGIVRTRYLPLTEGQAVIEDKQRRIEVPAAFSPWVIAPGMISRPSIIVGTGYEIETEAFGGGFKVVTEAPEVPQGTGVVARLSSQRRPRNPLR
jgi:hypothetical protein